jgi:glycosyltransferase involved in cell wall biosynthesis
MTNATKKSQHLEILLSTMHQSSLSFLEKMFSANEVKDFDVLIINQTNQEKVLKSENKQIRVINSLEKGLPKSRNIALKNASGEICLFADDDVVYVDDFRRKIISAFDKHKDADIITFQMNSEDGKLFRDYPDIIKHTKNTVYTANSVVIALKLEAVKNRIEFNPYFGLGAKFEVADEYIFLRDALNKGLSVYFEPQVILKHPKFSSGQESASDRVIYGRGALYYKYYGFRSYFRIAKHIYRTFNDGKLSLSEIIPKFGTALRGIKDYKQLLKQGLETR